MHSTQTPDRNITFEVYSHISGSIQILEVNFLFLMILFKFLRALLNKRLFDRNLFSEVRAFSGLLN